MRVILLLAALVLPAAAGAQSLFVGQGERAAEGSAGWSVGPFSQGLEIYGAVALSGFTQSSGYLLVAVAPLAVGLLHEWTGGWTAPLLLLLASAVPAAIAGTVVARPAYLEDGRR